MCTIPRPRTAIHVMLISYQQVSVSSLTIKLN